MVEQRGLVLRAGHLGWSGLKRELICSNLLGAEVVSPCCRDTDCLDLVRRLYCRPRAPGFCVQGLNKPERNIRSQPLPFLPLTTNFPTKPLLPLNPKRKILTSLETVSPKTFTNDFPTVSSAGASWCFRCAQKLGEQSRR